MHLWCYVRHVLFIWSPGSRAALSAQQNQLGMHPCKQAERVEMSQYTPAAWLSGWSLFLKVNDNNKNKNINKKKFKKKQHSDHVYS